MTPTGLIFCILFVAGCVLALARDPVYGAITYIATFFLSPQLRWWGQGPLQPIRWSLIAAAITLIAVFATRKRQQGLQPIRHPLIPFFFAFILWLILQFGWCLDSDAQSDFISYYVKFAIAILLVHRVAYSEENIRRIMWTYVAGCFYFGLIAYTEYKGGRFEDFGGAGINEANAGAVTLVTGMFVGSALFMEAKIRQKAVLLAMLPFIMNGLVTTISRSGFLAAAAGGIVFNIFTPMKFRRRVRILSALAVILFFALTGPSYWSRMQSLEYAGQNVKGVDTGAGRLDIISAQWRMFKQYPWGCGATCTTVLSPQYLPRQDLAGGVRASHNTFMTMLVDHGIVGALFYVLLIVWMFRTLLRLARWYRHSEGFFAALYPGIAASVTALVVGDMFVTYSKLEVRFWFVAILMALSDIAIRAQSARNDTALYPSGTAARLTT